MAVEFIPDPHKGPGNGIIMVSPMDEALFAQSPSFALTNASTRQCLSPEGWQSAEVFLEPTAWDCTNGQLRLAVGPQVVDNLDSLDMYRLQIKDNTGNVTSHTLAIKDIIQSSMAGGQGMGVASSAAVAATIAAAVATAEPEPIPEPTPEPAPEPTPEPAQELNMAQEENAPKSSLPLIIGIVLLCALLGLGAWWYFTQHANSPTEEATQTEEQAPAADEKAEAKDSAKTEENTEKEPENETEKATEQKNTEQQEADQSSESASAEKNSETAPAQLTPMQSARELLRQNDNGEKSHELATSLRSSAQNDAHAQDAVFLLLEDAAQKGVGPAMKELASYYDPTDTAPKGSISPDASEAYTWYTKADQAGESAAKEGLSRLRAWAEEEAQKGNATAKELLNNWK